MPFSISHYISLHFEVVKGMVRILLHLPVDSGRACTSYVDRSLLMFSPMLVSIHSCEDSDKRELWAVRGNKGVFFCACSDWLNGSVDHTSAAC